jgi:hypothetical protein
MVSAVQWRQWPQRIFAKVATLVGGKKASVGGSICHKYLNLINY